MKLNAIGVFAHDLKSSIKFYETIGFEFETYQPDMQHIESTSGGQTKLMLDDAKLLKQILGYEPVASNVSAFAIEFPSPLEVNQVADKLKNAGYELVKEPWDAFWGQRYCVVKDPSSHLIDLYASQEIK